jgi:hypothetical protein
MVKTPWLLRWNIRYNPDQAVLSSLNPLNAVAVLGLALKPCAIDGRPLREIEDPTIVFWFFAAGIGGAGGEGVDGLIHREALLRIPAVGAGRAIGTAARDGSVDALYHVQVLDRRIGAESQHGAAVQ